MRSVTFFYSSLPTIHLATGLCPFLLFFFSFFFSFFCSTIITCHKQLSLCLKDFRGMILHYHILTLTYCCDHTTRKYIKLIYRYVYYTFIYIFFFQSILCSTSSRFLILVFICMKVEKKN